MANMKILFVFPLALLAASCGPPPIPYNQQRPPMRDGEPYYPYGQGRRAYGQDGIEPGNNLDTGDYDYEEAPTRRNTRPPAPPRDVGPRADDYDPAPPEPKPQVRQSYPNAKSTDNPNEVISPYSPYNVIDVEGFKSGALAKDPSNGKIFRVP